jgi:hypothetical protein
MGLLDDAIREHLELKRLRGADPGEVAREQREALDPVPRDSRHAEDVHADADAHATAVSDHGADASDEIETEMDGVGEENEHEEPPSEREAPQTESGATDFSHVAQETAEIDMRTVLGEESSTEEVGAVQPRSIGEQAGPGELESTVEDVLEETPDFLRDTPEQDRLWFEQQPPRDFDFDK